MPQSAWGLDFGVAIRNYYRRGDARRPRLKLIDMPHRNSPAGLASPARDNFRQRYDDIEKRRDALLERLNRIGAVSKAHPGYKRALKLLNETFRNAKLAQRLPVLHAAAWLIDVLERLTTTL